MACTPCSAQQSDQYYPLRLRITRTIENPMGIEFAGRKIPVIIISTVDAAFGGVNETQFRRTARDIGETTPMSTHHVLRIMIDSVGRGCGLTNDYQQQTNEGPVYHGWHCPTEEMATNLVKQLFGDYYVVPEIMAQDRTAAMTVSKDQGLRLNLTNELDRTHDDTEAACEVSAVFLGSAGQLLTAPEVSGPVRALISLVDNADQKHTCAIRSTIETFDRASGKTLSALSTGACLGAAKCGL
jgi:hypothetical protein